MQMTCPRRQCGHSSWVKSDSVGGGRSPLTSLTHPQCNHTLYFVTQVSLPLNSICWLSSLSSSVLKSRTTGYHKGLISVNGGYSAL